MPELLAVWIDGVLRFDRSDNANIETGEWLGTTVVHSVENNIEPSENYFQPPE